MARSTSRIGTAFTCSILNACFAVPILLLVTMVEKKFDDQNFRKSDKQNQNLSLRNRDFDIEFRIWGSKIIFQKSKIDFSYSARISFRDHQIWIRRHRFTLHIFFHTKIQIFLLPKSWLCIRLQQIQHANWQVYNITTPANYFHALRKQCLRKFRKPLVIMSPKNLLRHKNCVSDIDEFTGDTKFLRVISERNPAITPDNVTRLIFCTGKIYYELAAERERLGLNHIAIVSMEQLTPFPYDKVCAKTKLLNLKIFFK